MRGHGRGGPDPQTLYTLVPRSSLGPSDLVLPGVGGRTGVVYNVGRMKGLVGSAVLEVV